MMEEVEVERDRVFHVQRFLGKGTFGTVWKAVWKTNSVSFPVAIKRVRTDKRSEYHECIIIESLHHPNIIKLHHKFYSFNDLGIGHLNLVMEYVSGSDLLGVINQPKEGLSLRKAVHLFRQLVNAVEFCHRHNIIHRDLKPANVMVNADHDLVKLIDFGNAKWVSQRDGGDDNYGTCYCVTRYYRAPELLLGNIHYGAKIDIWSLGCIFAEMMLGTPIFPGENDADQFFCIVGILGSPNEEQLTKMLGKYVDHPEDYLPHKVIQPIPLEEIFHSKIAEFLYTMLDYDPEKRWSAGEILLHPLLQTE